MEVFPQGSEMDVKPGKDAEEYAEYCRTAGWEFEDSRRRFCIFRKTAEDALSIVTEEERFKNIRKAEWKRCLMTVLTGVSILGMTAVQLSRVDVVLMLFSNMLLLPGLTLAVLFACEILQCIVLAVWCIKAGRRVRAGERPSYEKSWEKYVWYAMAVLILIALTEECCGVDIMEKVQRISKGRVKVGPGTLYAVLSKFEDNGIIRRTAEEGRRKSYIITESGRQR